MSMVTVVTSMALRAVPISVGPVPLPQVSGPVMLPEVAIYTVSRKAMAQEMVGKMVCKIVFVFEVFAAIDAGMSI